MHLKKQFSEFHLLCSAANSSKSMRATSVNFWKISGVVYFCCFEIYVNFKIFVIFVFRHFETELDDLFRVIWLFIRLNQIRFNNPNTSSTQTRANWNVKLKSSLKFHQIHHISKNSKIFQKVPEITGKISQFFPKGNTGKLRFANTGACPTYLVSANVYFSRSMWWLEWFWATDKSLLWSAEYSPTSCW